MDLSPGARVDRYVLIEPLGEGGQGAVWKAEDLLNPGQFRALKLVRLALSRPTDVERIRREARALARLQHPSLVSSHALFEDLRLAVLGIAMDYVDGASLRKHEQDAQLTQAHRVAILRHIAQALAYVHESGVVHRDLKLDNLLLTREFWLDPFDPKNLKLVDFGIAKLEQGAQPLTQVDTIIGTLAYLAPEQLDPVHFGESLPPAADVFAFGIVGWRLLLGGHPTGLPSNASVIEFATAYWSALSENKPWPGNAPPGPWGQLLRDCLSLRVRERIPNGQELARRCEALPRAVAIARPDAPATQAIGSRPTSIASPGAMIGQTVDFAPLPSQHGHTERLTRPSAPTQHEAIHSPTAPTAMEAPLAARASLRPSVPGAARQPRFPWALLIVGIVVLSASAAAAYYALRINLNADAEPEPPPLPVSVGSAAALPREPGADAQPASSARPAGCSPSATVCSCCPSGHDCAGECSEVLLPGERFALRPARVDAQRDAEQLASNTQLCLQLATRPDSESCTTLQELDGSRVSKAMLEVEALDLVQRGVEFALYQNWVSEVPIARGSIKRAVRRLELCKGLEVTELAEPGPVGRLVFYLDPIPGSSPGDVRCPAAQMPR